MHMIPRLCCQITFTVKERNTRRIKLIIHNVQMNSSNSKNNLGNALGEGRLHSPTIASELLVDHKSEDAHHGGTAVVQLDGALGQLGLLVEGVPAEVDGAVAEVTWEISGCGAIGGVLHHTELEGTNEENNLDKARSGDGIRAVDGGPAVGEGVEGVSRVVDVTREVGAGAGDEVAQEGELGDASVLDLDETEAVELLLVGAIEQAEGIKEAERGWVLENE